MDRGACWVTDHGVANSRTQLSDQHILNIRILLLLENKESGIEKQQIWELLKDCRILIF